MVEPKFRVGDVVVAKDDPFEPFGTVTEVVLEGDDEYLSLSYASGWGAGNADLFALVLRPETATNEEKKR